MKNLKELKNIFQIKYIKIYNVQKFVAQRISERSIFIGQKAFDSCTSLTRVEYEGVTEPICDWGSIYSCNGCAFCDANKNCNELSTVIYVPSSYSSNTFCHVGESRVSKTLTIQP